MYFITVETLQQVEKPTLGNAKQTILKETNKLMSTTDCWEFSLNCMHKGWDIWPCSKEHKADSSFEFKSSANSQSWKGSEYKFCPISKSPSRLKFGRLFSIKLYCLATLWRKGAQREKTIVQEVLKSPLLYLCLKKGNYKKRTKQLSNVNLCFSSTNSVHS